MLWTYTEVAAVSGPPADLGNERAARDSYFFWSGKVNLAAVLTQKLREFGDYISIWGG